MGNHSPVSNGRVGCLKHKVHCLDTILRFLTTKVAPFHRLLTNACLSNKLLNRPFSRPLV